MKSSRWMFEETHGEARIEQYVRTLFLRLKVLIWFRRWNRFKRQLSSVMDRG